MFDVEPLIVGELGEVTALETFDGIDWDDVLSRLGTDAQPQRPWFRMAIVAAVVFAVAAPALAFRDQFIQFLSAPHAKRPAVVEFGRMQIAAPFPAAAPGVLPHQARLITHGPTPAGSSSLSVAPTRYGGYCDFWQSAAPECLPRRSQARAPGVLGTFSYDALASGLGVSWIEGSVLNRSAVVTLHYAGGTTAEVPFVWVSTPIRAGFFDYQVPAGHDSPNARPLALTIKVKGHPEAREKIDVGALNTADGTVNQIDGWGQQIEVPPEADWSHRTLLASFNEKYGLQLEFWVMPSSRGSSRRCFVAFPFANACIPSILQGDPLQLAIVPGKAVILFGEVASNITRIRLRFQNGEVQQLRPKDGFLLTRLRPSNYPLHRRLLAADALDPTGRTSFVEKFDTTRHGIYPCAHPRNYGYGVLACP